MSAPHRPPSSSGRRRLTVAAIAMAWAVVAGVTLTTASPRPAAAQARRVHVSVRTTPAVPEPGTDVAVRVTISGCPPGAALVETFLTFTDGATQTSVLVDRSAAQSSLLFTSTAIVTLRAALRGWYGVRVICGEFRPPRAPMTNTYFVVGPRSQARALVGSPTVTIGGTLVYHGDACTGPRVEYSVQQVQRTAGAFVPVGSIPVAADGTWQAPIGLPIGIKAGEVRIFARCAHDLPSGDKAYEYYRNIEEVAVLPAPTSSPR